MINGNALMLLILFFIVLTGAVFSYFIYPLVMLLLPKRDSSGGYINEMALPYVTLIITAHNEASRITSKLDNALALDYPLDRFEIIVASDMSTDSTDDLVRAYDDHGVKLIRSDQHLGKEYAQSLAIVAAMGEILVFSDVATEMPADSLRHLVANFSKSSVGAVSSEDRFISADGTLVGEGAYVKYEMWLRGLESRVHSLVGLSGSFFAARREVCEDWDIRVPSDFNIALNCVRQGLVAVSDPKVLGYYQDIKDPKREYQRKLRTIIRGLSAVWYHRDVLNPLRYGLFSFQLWGHKVMRWLVPWFMLLLYGLSIALMAKGWLYKSVFYAESAFFLVALSAALLPPLRSLSLFNIPFYFIQVNLAIAHATVLFVFGKRISVWQPSER